jgi:hypothetical protein
LRTKDDVEVDLIIERPGQSTILLEIKSAERIDERHVKNLIRFQPDFPDAESLCVGRIAHRQVVKGIRVVPWKEALAYLFEGA